MAFEKQQHACTHTFTLSKSINCQDTILPWVCVTSVQKSQPFQSAASTPLAQQWQNTWDLLTRADQVSAQALPEVMKDTVAVLLVHLGVNVVARVSQLCDLFGQQFNSLCGIAEDDGLVDLQPKRRTTNDQGELFVGNFKTDWLIFNQWDIQQMIKESSLLAWKGLLKRCSPLPSKTNTNQPTLPFNSASS